uniref:Uncharacterized protein n=1 Tax=Rhizophora mucronata TaxID=61149 RepID=A0A2P2IVL4_RHIMU
MTPLVPQGSIKSGHRQTGNRQFRGCLPWP